MHTNLCDYEMSKEEQRVRKKNPFKMGVSHAIANTHNFNKHLQSALLYFKLKFDINIHKK